MHVDLSFSYLRFAEAASFDKKEVRRNCTLSHEMNLALDDMHAARSGLGLNKGRGQFLNFLGAPTIL